MVFPEEVIDHGLDHVTPAHKVTFTAETYVGNWYEETVRNTLKRQEFLMKRECEDLSIQRSQKMVDILLKPVELTANLTPYLHYGDTIQLISPGPDCKIAMDKYPFKKNYCKKAHLALSAAVPPSSIDHAPYLNTDSIISVSPHLFPVVRNSFFIENPNSPDDTKTPLNYGDVFRLRAMPTQHFPLYLFAAPGIRLHCGALHSAKPKVRLSDLKTSDTLWRAIPIDPDLQLQIEFAIQVPLKTRMMIKHACSGVNLSVETQFPVLTYFGEEYEVTVDTKRDTVKRITFENHWYFDTERGWRKPSDREAVEQAKYSAKINVHSNDESTPKPQPIYDEDEEEDLTAAEIQNQQMIGQPEIENQLDNMSLETGHELPYDPMTGPQPNAHSYRLSKRQEFYPNKKWNCGDTDCCHPRPPSEPQITCTQTKPSCFDYNSKNRGSKECQQK